MSSLIDYINNLKIDKTKMIEALRNKGQTVEDNATFTDLVPIITNMETGGGEAIEITDASYLFYQGARLDAVDALINAISPNCEKFNQMFMSYKGTEIPMFNCQNGKNFSQIFNGCSNITTIPQLDLSNCENLSYAFRDCTNLKTLPTLNLGKCTSFYNTFYNCSNLSAFSQDVSKGENFESTFYGCRKIKTIDLDLSNATNTKNMFSGCSALTSAIIRNSNLATDFNSMFYACMNLKTVELSTNSATSLGSLFFACNSLTDVSLLNCENVTSVSNMFLNCINLTNLGGFKDLGKAYLTTQSANYGSYTLNISSSSYITHDSMMNIINNVYDIATKGCNPQKIKVNSTVLGRLSEEEIAIATNKGWTVATN